MVLVQAQTLDELLRLMSKQKTTTSKALRELNHEVDATHFLYRADHTLTETSSNELSGKIQVLLYKYANQPTLTEFYQHPSWDGGFVYGGSFGVSAIVGTVFMKSWAEIFPEFAKIIKVVMMRVLEEQAANEEEEEADDTPLIERILPQMKFTIRDSNGIEILGKQRDKLIYNRVASLLQLMAQSFVTYGLLEVPTAEAEIKEGEQVVTRITPFGNRVYLHLRDVERYINEVAEVYPLLSKSKLNTE